MARLVVEERGGGAWLAECRDERLCRSLEARGYLREDGSLEPWEAAFMIARCVAELRGEGCGWLPAIRVAGLGGGLELFFVYYDLRRRGRIVRRGIRRGTLLVEQGGVARTEIRVLVEGTPMSIGELITWSRLAAADGREPVVAVVSGHGDVTYYTARAVTSFR